MKNNYIFFKKILLLNYSLYVLIHIIEISCEKECPKNLPIYDNNTDSCSLKYCTEEQFLSGECSIENSIVKEQWINKISTIAKSSSIVYPTIGKGTDNDFIFETNLDRNKKVFYSVEKDGRGFLDESHFRNNDLNNNNIFNSYGNSILVSIDKNKCFFKFSFYESIEVYDLVKKKYTINKLENLLGHKIQSYYNSLLRTNEENVFIYAYITTGNHLAMQKFKLISNDASNCIQIIKTLIEEEKTIPKNSRSCIITVSQAIECLDMDEEQVFYIRLYDKDLNFKNKYKLEKNNSPPERAFSTYHQAAWIKADISIFIFFNDISNNKARPIIYFRKYQNNNIQNLNTYLNREILYKDNSYIFSDTEHSLTSINDHYFALASLTTYSSNHLIISLISIFNDDRTIGLDYFDIPLKDIYDIDYHSSITSFNYNNFLGINFVHYKNNSYVNSMLFFSYGNSTDPTPIDNLFETYNETSNNAFKINLSNYVTIENNIFCYVMTGIKIISIPDPSTGIQILNDNMKQVKINEIIPLNKNITISPSVDIDKVKKGNYYISFAPSLQEPDLEKFRKCSYGLYAFGQSIGLTWDPNQFVGRISKFKFNVGYCFENCATCEEESKDPNDQKCDSCNEGFYFEKNTKNCYKYQNEGNYYNETAKIFTKCHKNCKSCNNGPNGDIQNCLSCKENYLLYNNSNCLNCKYHNLYVNYGQTSCMQVIQDGYYVNNTRYNTIDKCHNNCLKCRQGPTDDKNMNCLSCKEGYYFIGNTNNCEKYPYEGYYLDEVKYNLQKCYFACKTCSSGPIYNSRNELQNMNCDTCNEELGFYKIQSSNNCENKTILGSYYNSQKGNYEECYEDCLTCFDKEKKNNNNLIMNCLSCNESEGFHLYTKNGNNCLNCKEQEKYINFEENKCIDEIPKGYYLKNNYNNLIDSCYSKCETCTEKGTSDNNMKCDSCSGKYILLNNNCVEDMTCPNYFYFNVNGFINDTLNIKQKYCLNNKKECPNLLPFYYTQTSECVSLCPFEFLFSQGCGIANFEYGLKALQSLVEIEYAKGKIENFDKSITYSDGSNNYVTKVKIYPFIHNTEYNDISSNNIDNINDKEITFNNNEETEIILDECIELLKNESIISDEMNITMIKIDVKNNIGIYNYDFKLFDNNKRLKEIDLSLCYNNTIKIIIKNIINEISEKNSYDSDFYDNICHVFTSEFGTDVILKDRISDYSIDKDKNINLFEYKECPSDCELLKIDFKSKFVYCSCYLNGDEDNFQLIMNNKVRLLRSLETQSNTKSNSKVLKCIIPNISKYFSKSYVLIIFTFLWVAYILTAVIYFFFNRNNYIIFVKSQSKLPKITTLGGSIRAAAPPKGRTKMKVSKFMDSKSEAHSIKNSINRNSSLNIYNSNQKIDNNMLTIAMGYELADSLDIDLFDYESAITKDKRSILKIYFSIMQKRLIYIFAFKTDHNLKILKISLIIFNLINCYAVSLFFFNDDVIHKIYIDKGEYNSSFQIKYILLSSLICCIFLYIAKFIFIFKNSPIQILQFIKCVDFSLILLILLFLFYWLYIGSFTCTYINTQKHLSINFILTFIFCIIYEFILTLFSTILRKISLMNKTLPIVYNISILFVSLKDSKLL